MVPESLLEGLRVPNLVFVEPEFPEVAGFLDVPLPEVAEGVSEVVESSRPRIEGIVECGLRVIDDIEHAVGVR